MGGEAPGQAAYSREQAVRYEARRRRQLTWYRENEIIRRWSETVSPGGRVLDIPCGTGRLFPIFFARGLKVTGADLSDEMLAQVPDEYRNVSLLEGLEPGDATDLKYANGSFDYVVSLRLFHLMRVPRDVQRRMLEEFTRVARRGVVLHVPLRGRSRFTRAVDMAWRLFSVRREGPIHLARNRSRERARVRARPRNGAGGGKREVWRDGVWTLPELQQAFSEQGFRVSEVHGAISPFSSKKILIANRIEKSTAVDMA